MLVKKPSYGTSKSAIWLNTAMAWLVILGLVAGAIWGEPQAVALAPHVISWMTILIMGLLGIHRFAGAMDMRAMVEASRAGRARDEPFAETEPVPPGPSEQQERSQRRKEEGDA